MQYSNKPDVPLLEFVSNFNVKKSLIFLLLVDNI